MNLVEFKKRAVAASMRHRITFDGLLSDYGVAKSVVNRGVAGSAIDLATATRLLPLVTRLLQPGEVAALECTLTTGEAVVMSPETFAELRARFFHQPN